MNCLWRPCLLMDRDEMSNLYRGPSIDASYQVSVHLAEGFQRRRLKCEKLKDDGRQVMAKAHIWQGELKMYANQVQHNFFFNFLVFVPLNIFIWETLSYIVSQICFENADRPNFEPPLYLENC